MLVVKIEIWPGGLEVNRYEVGRMFVANITDDETPENDAYRSGSRGDYIACVNKKHNEHPPLETYHPHTIDERFRKGAKPTRIGFVRNYPRRSYVVWRLVMRCLRACFPEEK